MPNNKKLLLVESEMLKANGHFLDYLIETSNYFKKSKNIFWFLNRDFDPQNLHLPEYCNIKKIIKSNRFKRKKNKFYYFVAETFYFLKNFLDIFYFIYFFKNNKKKLFSFFKCLFLNYFIVPRYFKSFYSEYVKLNFNTNDNIVFQSCRRKDMALIFFLYNIENTQIPKTHIRIFHLPKKRFKDFYFYFDKIKSNIKKNIFLYTEEGKKKKILSAKLGSENLICVTKPIFSFYNRRVDAKNHTIGFIGEARINKGFNEIPKFIQTINEYDKNVNFIIQFSNVDDQTKKTVNFLKALSLKYKNIQIINKYCDYEEYRKILQKITIMPLLYDLEQIRLGSGVLYSCVSHEIIPIIPNNSDYLKEILSPNSFLEANNIDSFVSNTLAIIKNYEVFLSSAKKSSEKLTQSIKNDYLIKNITDS